MHLQEAGQPQAVGDDRDAGEAHGGTGDDRVEQAEGGQRDRCQVVAKGPAKVLQDGGVGPAGELECGRHAAQVRRQQGDVRGLDRDVGAGPDGDAEVGLHERGSVVDPVADHRHDSALALEPRNLGGLARRQHPGEDPVDTDLPGDRPGRRLVVPRHHHDLDAHRLQGGHRPASGGLQGVGDRQKPVGRAIPSGEDDRPAPGFEPGCLGGELVRNSEALPRQQRGPPDGHPSAVDLGHDAEAGDRLEVLDFRQGVASPV